MPYAARRHVGELINGCWATQVIHAAVKLGLPDQLAAGPLSIAAGADLTMMGMGGQERTADEYCGPLAAAGWRLVAITPCAAGFRVIEAAPV